MARTTIFFLVGLLLSACGGDDGPNLSKYAEQCMMTEDCEEPLVCANGLCTYACMGNSQKCAEVDSSGDSICMSDGYCYIACTSSQGCPADLQCEMVATTQGTCRP
jgi:hypothetical protein